MLPSHREPDALELRIESSLEYYVIENRQELAFGSPWSQGLAPHFCPGILIWHIDGAIADPGTQYWASNSVNNLQAANAPPHLGVTVKEADLDSSLAASISLECDDTYRIGSTFEGDAAMLWDGSPSGVSLRVLSSPDSEGRVDVAIRCPRCTAASPVTTTAVAAVDMTDGSVRVQSWLLLAPVLLVASLGLRA